MKGMNIMNIRNSIYGVSVLVVIALSAGIPPLESYANIDSEIDDSWVERCRASAIKSYDECMNDVRRRLIDCLSDSQDYNDVIFCDEDVYKQTLHCNVGFWWNAAVCTPTPVPTPKPFDYENGA